MVPGNGGITRRRAGRGFTYLGADGRRVREPRTLARIRAIAIPPAWTDVWICASPTGHIQATGRDARGRRQYRYHPAFRARRDGDKFGRLVEFGRALPRIRRRVARDLRLPGLPREKVLAAVVRLLETTRFRIGNAEYARLNRSFGLVTLRRRHARIQGSRVRFRFRGKGGREEEHELADRHLAAIVRRCQDLPGQELFRYLDEDGEDHAIDSADVNAYLRAAAGNDRFSAKDFRTWAATVLAFRARRSGARPLDAVRRTAAQINDSPAITRSAYVHPGVLETEVFDQGPSTPAAGRRPRHRAAQSAPDRAEELELLRLLREDRAARRPKARRGRSRVRATPPRA